MPPKVEEIIARVERALDWTFLCKPPSYEQRLQDIEAEIARLRRMLAAHREVAENANETPS